MKTSLSTFAASTSTLLLASCLATSWAAKSTSLPASWKTCNSKKPDFQECVRDAAGGALKKLVSGEPSLGVLPIDPLRLTALGIEQGSGPVSIDLSFRNLDMRGLTDLRLVESHVDVEKYFLTGKLVVDSPLFLDGEYAIKGRVLVLPISGSGRCNLTLLNPTLNVVLTGEKVEKHGEAYLDVKDFRFNIDTSRLYLDFENLFNGNKELGNTMNAFLNDNWQEILKELKPAISDGFGEAFKQISNRIFSKVPYTKIFLSK